MQNTISGFRYFLHVPGFSDSNFLFFTGTCKSMWLPAIFLHAPANQYPCPPFLGRPSQSVYGPLWTSFRSVGQESNRSRYGGSAYCTWCLAALPRRCVFNGTNSGARNVKYFCTPLMYGVGFAWPLAGNSFTTGLCQHRIYGFAWSTQAHPPPSRWCSSFTPCHSLHTCHVVITNDNKSCWKQSGITGNFLNMRVVFWLHPLDHS